MREAGSHMKSQNLFNEKYTKFKENKLEKISDQSLNESDYSGGSEEAVSKEKKTNQDEVRTKQDEEEQNLSPQLKKVEDGSDRKEGSTLRRMMQSSGAHLKPNSANFRSQNVEFEGMPDMQKHKIEVVTTLSNSNHITDSLYRERLQKELQLEKMKAIENLKRKFYYLHNELYNSLVNDKIYKSVRKYTVLAKHPRK